MRRAMNPGPRVTFKCVMRRLHYTQHRSDELLLWSPLSAVGIASIEVERSEAPAVGHRRHTSAARCQIRD